MDITLPITTLTGVGPAVAAKLAKLEIYTIFDLLYHLPFRYEDRSKISHLSEIQPGETVTVVGTLETLKNQITGKGRLIQKGVLTENGSKIELVWFNQSFLTKTLKPGLQVVMHGKLEFFGKSKALLSPDYEIFSSNLTHMGRIIPIYPETAGLTSKWFRTSIKRLLPSLTTSLPNLIPHLLPWHTAISQIHFPDSDDQILPARNRLAADEILLLQLAGLSRKAAWSKNRSTHPIVANPELIAEFTALLPFTLTSSQTKAVSEILADLSQTTPMNRLLEGDVGSGKTLVAAIAAYAAYKNNLRTLFLAPTQILAHQHHQTLTNLFAPLNVKIGLITGNSKLKSKNLESNIIIGTHALLNSKLNLSGVGLVIIDEQHRFGVMQRSLTSLQGGTPHILTMTATPIPRTLALVIHGDLAVSYLDQTPSGRLPIKTWVVPEVKRESGFAWIKNHLHEHSSQAFIVCPFIEPSETNITVKAVTEELAKLQKIFAPLSVGLLHGKLKSAEKDLVMAKFKAKEIDILLATPVVEVGIDVPNASVMVIEGADRFGLAQLHQLRGRVGRGSLQSYCLLFSDHESALRLKSLETQNEGRELAEIDFKLRGPGHLYGTAQHGQIQFKIATYDNIELISTVRALAETIHLKLANYPVLLKLTENDKISLIQPN